LAALAEVQVLAPVAVVEYGNPKRKFPDLASVPRRRRDGPLEVHHPRWFYPPLLGGTNSFWLWLFSKGVAEGIRREFPFDVIDAHFGHPEAAAAARLADRFQVPFAVTLRGNEPMHGASADRRRRMAWGLRRAGMVIAVSKPLREYAISLGVDPARTAVVPNGIDGAVFHPRDRAECRQRLGFAPGLLHILSAGYLIERKGHHRIVEALPQLRQAGLPAQLWIVGDPGREGDFAREIHAAVERAGAREWVRFVPAVPASELAAYMSACDVFCLASNREGWPNVVNEALACGAPVVAADVGGVPEMLPDERFGYVTPPMDSSALLGALSESLRRAQSGAWERDAIAARGRARSWAEVAKETLSHLEFAVKDRTPPKRP
jgi:glycosyltransferase involved in cell wall biosynthesis